MSRGARLGLSKALRKEALAQSVKASKEYAAFRRQFLKEVVNDIRETDYRISGANVSEAYHFISQTGPHVVDHKISPQSNEVVHEALFNDPPSLRLTYSSWCCSSVCPGLKSRKLNCRTSRTPKRYSRFRNATSIPWNILRSSSSRAVLNRVSFEFPIPSSVLDNEPKANEIRPSIISPFSEEEEDEKEFQESATETTRQVNYSFEELETNSKAAKKNKTSKVPRVTFDQQSPDLGEVLQERKSFAID